MNTLASRINMLVGLILVGIGVFFIFFRPAFLPEDLSFIGTPEQISNIPNLSIWLHRVFTVLGGYILSTGILVISVILLTAKHQAKWFLLAAWIPSVALMTLINFMIKSDFKWALTGLAVLWLAGIALWKGEPKPR